jgi:hypothetical protein
VFALGKDGRRSLAHLFFGQWGIAADDKRALAETGGQVGAGSLDGVHGECSKEKMG